MNNVIQGSASYLTNGFNQLISSRKTGYLSATALTLGTGYFLGPLAMLSVGSAAACLFLTKLAQQTQPRTPEFTPEFITVPAPPLQPRPISQPSIPNPIPAPGPMPIPASALAPVPVSAETTASPQLPAALPDVEEPVGSPPATPRPEPATPRPETVAEQITQAAAVEPPAQTEPAPVVKADPLPETAKTTVPPLDLTKYETGFSRFLGWIMYLFDYALKIREGDQEYYLSIKELATRITPNLPSNAKRIHRVMLEILNPIRKDVVTLEKIHALIQQGPLQNLSEEKLESLRNQNVEPLSYDPQQLQERLQPGDVIFKKMPDDSDNLVVWGQRFFQWLIPGRKEREAYKYSHVALYLGNGQIAEAVPESAGCEVRILSLSDERFALSGKNGFLISRSKDKALNAKAVEIARNVAAEVQEKCNIETNHKYSRVFAAASVMMNSSFGPFARYRYVRNYDDVNKNRIPRDYFGLKQFFCSYFASYCFQVADSLRVMPKIIHKSASPDVPIPIVNRMIRSLWSRICRIAHWGEMTREVKLKFDAKRLTPQDFRNFIIRNPDQFEDVYIISSVNPSSVKV